MELVEQRDGRMGQGNCSTGVDWGSTVGVVEENKILKCVRGPALDWLQND